MFDEAEARSEPIYECPICGARAVETYRPFCSKRCANVDLGRWLNGSYAVPTVEADEPDDDRDDS